MRDFRKWLKDLNGTEISMLVVHAIAHGEHGGLIDSADGVGHTIDDILGTVNDVPTLQNIPTAFFPNVCRGGKALIFFCNINSRRLIMF